MNLQESAKFRATTGPKEAFGMTPQEALDALMEQMSDAPFVPIVIRPFDPGDAVSTGTQDANGV